MLDLGWIAPDSRGPGTFGPACHQDQADTTVEECADRCERTGDCLAFDLYLGRPAACYIFRKTMTPPFTAVPSCLTCVKDATVNVPATARADRT